MLHPFVIHQTSGIMVHPSITIKVIRQLRPFVWVPRVEKGGGNIKEKMEAIDCTDI